TREQVNEDRDQASEGNVESNSGETLEQLRLGLKFSSYINKESYIEALSYIITRDFEQRLPFGIVSFDR
ncbi:MAG: hypothetical protein GTN99_04945, partial [Candidatus Dadabacteria bacterium]|nr:hypothetical protein [Candidatus Dadabacteria bacterium]NIT13598.1 hypothetical protein [Candidatus Dadabacteria bacterium]